MAATGTAVMSMSMEDSGGCKVSVSAPLFLVLVTFRDLPVQIRSYGEQRGLPLNKFLLVMLGNQQNDNKLYR